MTTLTDRYVAAVLRSVPDKSRPEIERELRASIADATDAHVARGETLGTVETAVLTELGDPRKLAAEYAGTRYLIGPAVFDPYVRSLGLAVALLVPGSWLLLLGTWLAGGSSLATALLTAFVGSIFVGLMAAFWTTLTYAALDHSADARRELEKAFGSASGPWTPDRLPATASIRPIRPNEAVEAVIGGSIGIALVFVQRSVSPFSDASGQPIPLLNPDLWSAWIPIIIAISIALICAEFVLLAVGQWRPSLALVISLLTLASATVYIYLLATGQLFNPAFVEKLGIRGWVDGGSGLILLVIFLTVVDTATRIARLWGAPIGNGR